MMDALASRNSRKPCGYSSSPDGAFSISLLGVPDESEKSPVWLGGLDVSMSVTGSVGTVFSSVSDMLGKVLLCRLCRFGLAARCVVDEKPKVGALKSRKKKRDWRPALELRAGTANCRKLNNRQGSQDKKKRKSRQVKSPVFGRDRKAIRRAGPFVSGPPLSAVASAIGICWPRGVQMQIGGNLRHCGTLAGVLSALGVGTKTHSGLA